MNIEVIDDNQKYERQDLSIPASVTGYDHADGKWNEITRTLSLDRAGVTLLMRKAVQPGMVLHLTLPLPMDLREYGHRDTTYKVYSLVRQVEQRAGRFSVVSLEFLGERPPVGYLSKPWATFRR